MVYFRVQTTLSGLCAPKIRGTLLYWMP